MLVQSRAEALRSSDYKPCAVHCLLRSRDAPRDAKKQLQPLHCRRGDERLQAHAPDASAALDHSPTSRSERSAILEQSQGGLLRRLRESSSGCAPSAPASSEAPDGAPTHRLAVCAGLDVKVLSIRAGRAVESAKSRSVGKLKDVAQSVSWRRDGRLLCVGDGKGSVHVVDAQTGATLRRLSKGHEFLCRDACFLRATTS